MSVLFYPRNIGIELASFFQMSSNDKECCCSYMPLATLKRVVSDMEHWPTIETIFLLGLADRLLRPDYPEVLKILLASSIAREARVIQYEDASLLEGAKAEGILDVPVIDEIVFSLDGSKDHENCTATFEEEHQKAVQNLSSFARARNLKRPDLVVSLHVIDASEKNLQKHSKSKEHIDSLLSSAGINIYESKEMRTNKKNACYSNRNNKQLAYSFCSIEKLFVHTILLDRNSSYDSENQLGNEPSYEVKGGCVFIEEDFLFISVDGFAKPCCASIGNEFNIGSIHDSDLGDLLNSNSMNVIRHSLRLDQRENLEHCRECLLSNSMAGLASLELLWKKRDEQFLIDDQKEREYIFYNLLSVKHKVKRVDLGCGPVKLPGFIGVDRYPLPRVDVMADLNSRLPFEDNSVDLVYASHSLEHVKDLLFSMAEIYRICKDGAQVCIVAPYYMQGLNLANPYHLQVFNEHTPRFWTNEHCSPVPSEVFSHPHAPMWGLAWSDHSEQTMDFRCMRMDFFYFPEYRAYPQNVAFKKMKTHIDVCDQIMYNLIVVKNGCMNHEDIQGDKMEYFEPPYITIRKLREELARVQEDKGALQGELARVQEAKGALQEDLARVQEDKGALQRELVRVQEDKGALQGELKTSKDDLVSLVQKSGNTAFRLATEVLSLNKGKSKLYSMDYDVVHSSVKSIIDSNILQSNFIMDKYTLHAIFPLAAHEIVAMQISPLEDNLSGLRIAMEILGPVCYGNVAVEILTEQQEILRTCFIEADHVMPCFVQVRFSPIQCELYPLWLRVVGGENALQSAVVLYQWRLKNKLTRKDRDIRLVVDFQFEK